MMDWTMRGRESGLSVVEVLVAVVILAFVLAWNAQMTQNVLLTDQRAQLALASSRLAVSTAEQFRRAGFDARSRTAWRDVVSDHGARMTWTAEIEAPEGGASENAALAVLDIGVNWEKGTISSTPQKYRTLLRRR